MGTMMKVAAALLVAAACVYFAARLSPEETPGTATIEPPTADLLDAEFVLEGTDRRAPDPVAATGPRSPVAKPTAGDEPAVTGTNILRVVVEGVTDEYAAKATVTVAGVKVNNERPAKMRDTWPCRGSTSEFDLDPLLARLAERQGVLRVDEFVVIVDHPQHFSETVRVPLSSGAQRDNGQTLYDVEVRLAEVVYWPELTFAVRDANTRAHLDGVELRCAPTAYMGLLQQPGASEPFTKIGTDLSSPIAMRGGREVGQPDEWAAGLALRAATGEPLHPAEFAQPEENARGVMMYARAPGYAWGRVVLDVSQGAQRELLLEPGAAVSVRVANAQLEQYAALDKRATLDVRKIDPEEDETTVWSRDLDDVSESETIRIDALEPGDYVVLVELRGSWQRKPTELARETITIPAGETREVSLVIPDPPEPPAHATLGGVVSFPHFGGEEAVRLEFYASDYRYGDPDFELPLTELDPVDATLPTWSFRIEGLPVDRYQVRLLPFLESWMVELPESGRDDVEFVIPEFAEVLVDTVDARTGERVPLDTISYRTLDVVPGQVTHGGSGPWVQVESEGEPGRFRFWTAPGAFAVKTWPIPDDLDLGPTSDELELTPGLQSLRLELSPPCILRFEFRLDGAALPHEDGVFVGLSRRIRAVGHDGRVAGLYPYSLCQASAPGLYDISFEGVGADRFQPIPPRRVEVRAGETTDVIVELERK